MASIAGIIIAIVAVYLTFKKSGSTIKPTLAIILFFGAGILDMWIDFIRNNYLSSNIDFNLFIVTVFFTAFGVQKKIFYQLFKNCFSKFLIFYFTTLKIWLYLFFKIRLVTF